MPIVPILMYHNLGIPPAGAGLPEMYVPAALFRRQLGWLRRIGYRGVSMSDALPYLRGERRGRVVALTFDDGYSDTFDIALPLLRRYRFTATCYVVSGRIGEYNAWDADELGVRKPLMDADQVREWAAQGMEVGAHTVTHPRLSACDGARVEQEITGGKEELEDLLGRPVTQFSYPYGDIGVIAPQRVRAAGFSAATTTRRGRASHADDPFLLPRIPVKGHKPAYLVPLRVLTSYEDRRT